jgi:hypothetical protein
VDDYTGNRYFLKYTDYNDDNTSVDYYCSEEEDTVPVNRPLETTIDARPQGTIDEQSILADRK